jgi:transposase-like protein
MSSVPSDVRLISRPRRARVVRKRSAEEQQRLLGLLERSGQSQKQFCREHGVALSSLTFWLRRARRSARGGSPGVLVEVPSIVASRATVREAMRFPPRSVEVRLPNRLELNIEVGTDCAWIGHLLQELLTCSG